MRKTFVLWLLSAALLLPAACLADMQALDDGKLSGVTGTGNGIAFDIVMQINTDASGTPTGSAAQITACQNGTAGGCPFRMAAQFENRPGGWLVMKDFFGMIKFNSLNLDAYMNPTTNTAFYNKNRFANAPFGATQTCMSDVGSTACNPAGMNSFMFTFPSASFSNIGMYVNIGRMAVEFDNNVAGSCASINDTTNCGYVLDNRGSFAGIIMSDITQKMAQISVGGQVRVYGF